MRLFVSTGLGVLLLILAGPARADFTCPPTDQLGFALGPGSGGGDPLFCSYPAVAGEDPNDFFCTYSLTTGALVEDHDAGLCPPNAAGTAPVLGTPTQTATQTATATATETATPTNTRIPNGGACMDPIDCASRNCVNGICAGVAPAPTASNTGLIVLLVALFGAAMITLRLRRRA
jgi:MYXO-CTERM domain-containing protein